MNKLTLSALCAVALLSLTHAACSANNSTQPTPTPTPVTPAAPTPPKPTLAVPALVSPVNGESASARPTLTVANAERTGTLTGPVTYTFEVADNSGFAPVGLSGAAQEGTSQTSFTLATDLPGGRTYYWRATASVQADGLTAGPTGGQSFTVVVPSAADRIATQQGVVLWPGIKPPGATGQAKMGPGWGVGSQTSFDGVTFQSPPIEVLRVFDLMDRGMSPDAAIGWMRVNGYPSIAVYYDSVKSIGFPYQYLALIGGAWELVRRVGA